MAFYRFWRKEPCGAPTEVRLIVMECVDGEKSITDIMEGPLREIIKTLDGESMHPWIDRDELESDSRYSGQIAFEEQVENLQSHELMVHRNGSDLFSRRSFGEYSNWITDPREWRKSTLMEQQRSLLAELENVTDGLRRLNNLL